jgi:hypothetical protein
MVHAMVLTGWDESRNYWSVFVKNPKNPWIWKRPIHIRHIIEKDSPLLLDYACGSIQSINLVDI